MQQSGGSTETNTSSTPVVSDGTGTGNSSSDVQDQLLKSQEEQKALEEQLKKLKDDIAKSKKEAKALQKIADDSKANGEEETGGAKRKAEESSDSGGKKMKSENEKE